jgi:hypothetical protein
MKFLQSARSLLLTAPLLEEKIRAMNFDEVSIMDVDGNIVE